MEWQELAFAALLVLAALVIVGWISRQLQQPLEWMIDSQIDPASEVDGAPVDDGWPAQPVLDAPVRDAKLQRGW